MSSYSHSTNKALNSNTKFFKELDLLQVFQESERKKLKQKNKGKRRRKIRKKETENEKEKERGC